MQKPPTAEEIYNRLSLDCPYVCLFCGDCMDHSTVDLLDGPHDRWTCPNCGQGWTAKDKADSIDEIE